MSRGKYVLLQLQNLQVGLSERISFKNKNETKQKPPRNKQSCCRQCATVRSLSCCCWGQGCTLRQVVPMVSHASQLNTQNEYSLKACKGPAWKRQVIIHCYYWTRRVRPPEGLWLAVSSAWTLSSPSPAPFLLLHSSGKLSWYSD